MTVTTGIAVVAPFSTGELLAVQAKEMGYKVCLIFPSKIDENNNVLICNTKGDATIIHSGDIGTTLEKIKNLPFTVEHILAGAENGVILADMLAHEMGLLHNPIELSNARRSKYHMQETIRAAGIRATKQIIATEWEPIEAFLKHWNPDPFKVIVKPNASAGSDDVFLCKNIDEVRAGFNTINGAINGIGEVNEGVLVQEFLAGTEYVIDSVSVNGVHKVVAVWQYDKRQLNGAFNVYAGMSLKSVNCDLTKALVEYSAKVLDALHIVQGPSHMEVMFTQDGPCLVEVGSRVHGGGGTWITLANTAFGYNMVGATLDSYLRQERWEALPPFPTSQTVYAKELFLISYENGEVTDMSGMNKIRHMTSFLNLATSAKVGKQVSKTVDLFTSMGRVQLLHPSSTQVENDYNVIHELMLDNDIFRVITPKAQQANEGPAE